VLEGVGSDAVRGANARAHYLAELTPERAMRTLLDVYDGIA